MTPPDATARPPTESESPRRTAASRWRRARASWRSSLAYHHDFRQLWAGDAVSQLGVQLVGLAMPVVAVQVLAAGAFEMGLLATFEMLAFLVIGLPAGAWVDRWRKKQVLIVGDAVRALLLLTLPAAYLADALTLTQLYLVALGVGAATVFFDVAYQSYLPDLVPPEQISEGNAKLQAVQSVAQVAGPALGGGLIRVIGAIHNRGHRRLHARLGRVRLADPPPRVTTYARRPAAAADRDRRGPVVRVEQPAARPDHRQHRDQ